MPRRGPMNLFVNRTTRKANHENQIPNINYDQNSASIKKNHNKFELALDKA